MKEGCIHKNVVEKLSLIQELIPSKYKFSNLEFEKESLAYWACSFEINNQKVIFRKAKTTPSKVGQFVTIWKRNAQEKIEPFCIDDNFNFIIVSVSNESEFGQFVFPKSVLVANGIVSTKNKEGKRGFRVYPPWVITKSKQAITTQEWQLKYFLALKNNSINRDKAIAFFNLNGN
ncbi:MepB family protein [Aureibaculum marinum]|uniref:MepB family protein n=1 Tax=Aureibaculum marinum TaxID=2487930 RepID=A0A3N4P414_9FLAO|nr:MepB family protein [Aureibaculum marinum]RPD99676.1 MepB family protein [Aureibaculum marinum]